jgi:hypothetical protein
MVHIVEWKMHVLHVKIGHYKRSNHLYKKNDLSPYAITKLSLNVSEPYLTTVPNNKSIIAFSDWYNGPVTRLN